MITNERQFRITKAQADKFAKALESFDEVPPDEAIHPYLRKAEREAMESQLADLRQELQEYERLSSGLPQDLTCESLGHLAASLITARIASGLTQKELARMVGLKEQ